MCVFVCALRLYPATPGLDAGCGWVCLGLCFGCAPPLLAGVFGCVCVCLRALLVPRHLWLGCAVCVCLLTFRFWLCLATPGWGVGFCVRLCSRSSCRPPLLAGVCGVGVCVWARDSVAPRHSWLGCCGVAVLLSVLRLYPATPGCGVRCGFVCLGSGFGCAPPLLAGVLGCACICVRAPLVLRPSWLAVVVCGFGVAWHLFLCRCSLRVMRAAGGCGTRWPLLLATCLCALVLAGGVPLQRVSWPRVGASRLLWSGRSRCYGRLSGRCPAFPHPRVLRPWIYWAAARGTWRPAENGALCACRWPLPRQGPWARSASYQLGAPRLGCPRRVPPPSILGCVRCGGLRVWTWSLRHRVSRPARLWTGDSGSSPGLFCVDTNTAPLRLEDATPGFRACVRVCAPLGQVWRTGLPGAFRCASSFPVAGRGAFFDCSAPSGLGLPLLCLLMGFFSFPWCAPVVFGAPCFPARDALGLRVLWSSHPAPLFSLLGFFLRSRCQGRSVSSGPGCLWPWCLVVPPPAPPLCFFFPRPRPVPFFFAWRAHVFCLFPFFFLVPLLPFFFCVVCLLCGA